MMWCEATEEGRKCGYLEAVIIKNKIKIKEKGRRKREPYE